MFLNVLRRAAWALRTLGHHLIAFVYPPFCLHCGQKGKNPWRCLCHLCVEMIDRLPLEERCRRCSMPVATSWICATCQARPSYFSRHISAFDHFGPMRTLVSQFLQGDLYLAPRLAAWMVLQYAEATDAFPDQIVPVPEPLYRRLRYGAFPHEVLAREVGVLLQRPVGSFLSYVWSEEGGSSYYKKRYQKRLKIVGQRMLLISAQFDRVTIENAARALKFAGVAEISALTAIVLVED